MPVSKCSVKNKRSDLHRQHNPQNHWHQINSESSTHPATHCIKFLIWVSFRVVYWGLFTHVPRHSAHIWRWVNSPFNWSLLSSRASLPASTDLHSLLCIKASFAEVSGQISIKLFSFKVIKKRKSTCASWPPKRQKNLDWIAILPPGSFPFFEHAVSSRILESGREGRPATTWISGECVQRWRTGMWWKRDNP